MMMELAPLYETGASERVYSGTKLLCAITALEKRGIDYQPILSRLGMDRASLMSGTQKISIEDLLIAFNMVLDVCSDPTLPYEMGKSMHVTDYGMYGFAVLSCMSFEEMMHFGAKYHQLATPLNSMVFVNDEERTGWVIDPIAHPLVGSDLYQFITIFQLSVLISLHRDLKGPDFSPERIDVAFYNEGDYQLTESDVGCTIEYGEKQTVLHIGKEWLEVTPRFASGPTFEHLKHLVADSLSDLNQELGEVAQVRRAIMASIANPPSLEEIADDLAMTPRTLRRRMAEKNKCYRDIRDEILAASAIKYARENILTTSEMAYVLGFSDAASLRRAFRRWTGKSPTDFR